MPLVGVIPIPVSPTDSALALYASTHSPAIINLRKPTPPLPNPRPTEPSFLFERLDLFQIKMFEQALKHIRAHQDDVWFATGSEIAKHFIDNYWDSSLEDIKQRGMMTGGTGFAS